MSTEAEELLVRRNNTYEPSNAPELKLSLLATRPQPNYGSNPGPSGQNFEKITYTWSEINVYADLQQSKRNVLQNLRFSRQSSELEEKKVLLKDVFGAASPGEFLAILGSSGAGKTTLLNALTFHSPAGILVTGFRCINGIPVNNAVLTSQSAYVQQEDLFIGCLTVREHLTFQALVRMDRHIPYRQRMKRVEEVISELGLTKCQHTQIGIPGRIKGISGGEMKRLSFASEVLTNPSLMFCDEPTSGLDSFMAQNVVQVLKGLADTGKTVICTIHQPSSELYAMFDKLLLMAEGRVAFMGTPEEAAMFFADLGAPCPKNYNPADYYIQLLAMVPSREESCRQAVDLICDQFSTSDVGVRLAVDASTLTKTEWNYEDLWMNNELVRTPYKAGWCAQFRAVLWRSWRSVLKEPMLVKVRLLQTIMVSLLIGLIYFGQTLDQDGVMNLNGALFIFLTNMTFQNLFAVINVFCSELPIFLREHRNGMYRVDVYFLCKTLAEAPLFILIPVLFTGVAYFMIGFNPESSRFLFATLIVVLVANVSTSFGYLISCASSSVSMALSIGPPIVIPFLLFGGFFLNAGSVPVYFEWLSYLSWFRYGNEALLINQWDGVDNITCTRSNSTCPRTGHIVLQALNFSENNFRMDLIGLALLILGFRLLAFLALLSKTFRQG
ncbi:white [Carabus blaptoides fortunei]